MDITIRKVQAHQNIAECVQFNTQTLPLILEWFILTSDEGMTIRRDPQGYLELSLTHCIHGELLIQRATDGDYVVFVNGHLQIIGFPYFDLVYQWVEE